MSTSIVRVQLPWTRLAAPHPAVIQAHTHDARLEDDPAHWMLLPSAIPVPTSECISIENMHTALGVILICTFSMVLFLTTMLSDIKSELEYVM